MTEKPLVSVIINCYNSEKYLRETIDSLIAQTYDNWEAIFWDNCSTDKTAEIIASYNESRFRYFLAEKNTPLGEARNLAMEKVQGELLCFLDSDDVWVKDFLKIGVEKLVGNNELIGFYCNYFLMRFNSCEANNLIQCDGVHSLRDVLRYSYAIGMSGCIVLHDVVRKHSIQFDNHFQLVEDLDFFVKVLEHGCFSYSAIPLYYYRIHPNNTSHKYNSRWIEEYSTIYDGWLSKYVNISQPIFSASDIVFFRNRIILLKIEDLIEKDDRKGVLAILLKNRHLTRNIWYRLVYVLLGKKAWTNFKGYMNR